MHSCIQSFFIAYSGSHYPFAGFTAGVAWGVAGKASAVPLPWQAGAGVQVGFAVHLAWQSFISFFDIFLPSQAAIASGEQEANTAVPGSIITAVPLVPVAVALAQHEGDGVQVVLLVCASALEIARPPSMHKIIITLFIGNQFVCELIKNQHCKTIPACTLELSQSCYPLVKKVLWPAV